jgi:hypothetical protein
VAAVIPVASLLNRESAIIPGVLGAVILLLEGLQELGNYRNNWQKYRGACEALRHEKYLFLAGAGPYSEMEETVARRALAERVEEMISQEHTDWKRQFQKQEKGQ